MALTTDGKRAVSGSVDHTLRVWDLEGHRPPRVLEGRTNGVTAAALTADGKRAVFRLLGPHAPGVGSGAPILWKLLL